MIEPGQQLLHYRLVEETPPGGGTWGSRDDIVFSAYQHDELRRVPAAGGGGASSAVTVVEKAGVDSHLWPSFLPDGEHFLYLMPTYGSDERMGQIRIGSLDGATSKVQFPSDSNAIYSPPGHLLWWHDDHLRAQRFDTDRLDLVGEAFPLVPDVRFEPRSGLASVSVSDT